MPATTGAQQIPAIVQWFQLYGNILFFFTQLAWWIVTGFAAGWAACTLWRFLKLKMGYYDEKIAALKGSAASEPSAPKSMSSSSKDDKDKVDVDKFVD